LSAAYHKHEQEKHRAYEEKVQEVDHSCFTHLVFSTSGGMGKAATVVYPIFYPQPYPLIMGWLRFTFIVEVIHHVYSWL